MAKYTIKQVGDPNKMGDKREITIYKIYVNGKFAGTARYRPSLYKSKYSIKMDVFKMPKIASDWYKNQGNEYRGKNLSGEPRSFLPAGDSAKNPTAVLKQFKSRWESRIEYLTERAKKNKKAKAKLARGLKKTGLSPSQYEQLGKYKGYIENNKKDLKESLRKIKAERRYMEIYRSSIKRWTTKINELKKKK